MEHLQWLDIAIVAIILLMIISGFKAGLIATALQVIGIVAGLVLASKYYAPVSDFLYERFEITVFEADITGFVALFISVYIVSILAGILLSYATRFRFVRFVNKVGGSIAGLAMGVAITSIFLILLSTFSLFPVLNEQMERSFLASRLLNAANETYEDLKEGLPLDLPPLAFFPEGITGNSRLDIPPTARYDLDFEKLDGATCIACNHGVEFNGYHTNNYGTVSPRFKCAECGRISDGCQTYEGYHLLYEACPAALGRRGYRFECGIWTNNSFIRPGPDCPVCD